MRLMGEDRFWNGTVDQAKAEMIATLTQYLDTESIYRLAQGTEQASTDAATYSLEKVEELKAEQKAQEQNVKEKKAAYPEQKQAINADRDLILTLIKMVESIGSEDDNATTVAKKDPAAAKAELKSLQSDIQLFQTIGSRFTASGAIGSSTMSAALLRLKALGRRGKGMMLAAPTPEEMASTREAVKSVLLELLQDPAFRDFLLESGLADSVQGLLTVNEKIATKEVMQRSSLMPAC